MVPVFCGGAKEKGQQSIQRMRGPRRCMLGYGPQSLHHHGRGAFGGVVRSMESVWGRGGGPAQRAPHPPLGNVPEPHGRSCSLQLCARERKWTRAVASPALCTLQVSAEVPYEDFESGTSQWTPSCMARRQTKERMSNAFPFLEGYHKPGPNLFCDTGGGWGGDILEEAGTFSRQALLLSYPYPRGGGSSQGGRHPLTALSTVPTQYQTTCNATNREGLTTAC